MTRVSVREGLSQRFDAAIEFVTTDGTVDLEALLWTGAACAIAPAQAASEARYFHGIVEDATYLGFDRTYHHYRTVLRSRLDGLAYRVRTRIFQNKNTVDIVKQVFTDAGIPADAVSWSTQTTYPVREYCAQWKESELAYVLRLLEDEGMFYWFEHTELEHVLHVADSPSAHQPIAGDPRVPWALQADAAIESVWGLVHHSNIVHDGAAIRDWYFKHPSEPLEGKSGDTFRQRYEYPGGYTEQAEGTRRALVRFEEHQVPRVRLTGRTDVLRLLPGRTFEITGAHPEFLSAEWLVTELEHEFHTVERSESGVSGFGEHTASFAAIPSEVVFRPPRVARKPRVFGLESAVVTGPAGEEIHVDEFGRIKVHFYWDRENPVDDTASCWLRVQQLNTSGAMILPRVGWEVHVAFVDGDPDRPVALHKAYNQETMPPYAQPANKTQSSMQSSTSPGGGATNEIRMQDGNGGMEFALHASKDMNVVVANDQKETIDVDAEEKVGGTFTGSVDGDESGTVSGNQSLSVTKKTAIETTGAQTVTVGGNDDWGITGNFGFDTTGDRTDHVSGMMFVRANSVAETFSASLSRKVASIQAIVAATAISETVGGSKTETVGAAKAVITPKDYAESLVATKTLNSGAVMMKAGGDVTYGAKGAIAVTAAGIISIQCADGATFTGSQVRVTSGRATFKGGGGEFKLSGSITIDANKFGGKGGPMLKVKGSIDYKD